MVASPVPRSAWHGTLQLTYARSGDATQIVQSHSQAPLKLQRPFYPEGVGFCHSVVLHTAGGIVGGDRLSLSIELQSGAQVLLTTAAAAKIYRSNGLTAQQTIDIQVAPGACLEWLPLDTIVFEQAQYRQDLRVELAEGAHWLGWEITRFGRSARGEQFLAGDWRSHTEVWRNGRPLWCDRQWLPGSELAFNGLHGLAGCPVVGSFAFVGTEVDKDCVEKARSLLPLTSGEGGVTRLQSGLLCRYRGHSSTEAKRWFVQVWDQVRRSYLGREACVPRVWGV